MKHFIKWKARNRLKKKGISEYIIIRANLVHSIFSLFEFLNGFYKINSFLYLIVTLFQARFFI